VHLHFCLLRDLLLSRGRRIALTSHPSRFYPPAPVLYQLVQIIYWLALSTWFGSVLFVALAAPVIFRTVGQSNPILSDVLSVNLEGQHATLLAGTIVGNLLQRLLNLELICGGALLITLAIQPFVIDMSAGAGNGLADNRAAALVRSILFLAAAAVTGFDRLVVWPKLMRHRDTYIEHADEPEVANPAKDAFDREQRRSVTLLMTLAALLLGMILFSANITPPPVAVGVPMGKTAS